MKSSKLAIGCLLLASPSLLAQTVLVDFGRSDPGQPTPDTGWNNITAEVGNLSSNTTEILDLVDETGDPTGYSLTMSYVAGASGAGAGADYSGPYPASVASYPASAISDGFFINVTGSITMSIGNLDPTLLYDVRMYGARGNNGTEVAVSSESGSGTTETTIPDTFVNATDVAELIALTPTAEGTIEVTMRCATGTGGALNVLIVEAYSTPDDDEDGMPNSYEIANGTNPNLDDANEDFDEDGLTNLQEYLGLNSSDETTGFGQTDSGNADTDQDGLDDGDEVSGALNPWDINGFPVTAPGAPTNPNDSDSDNDSLNDFEELDASNGSVTDPNWHDTDQDGMSDYYEASNDLDPTSALGDDGGNGDPDEDDLSNFEESLIGTDPKDEDSDDDTLSDGDEELFHGTSPLLTDTDGDLLDDAFEVSGTTDPLSIDTDDDRFTDYAEIEAGSDGNDANSLPTFPSIAWSAVEFNSTSAISNSGTLLYAENYAGEDVTVNGVTFAGTNSSATERSSLKVQTFLSSASTVDLYDDEVSEIAPLLETFWWEAGSTIGNISLTGLTPGQTYQVQLGRADDRDSINIINRYARVDSYGGNTGTGGIGADNTIFGGPLNPALLFTGTFTATSSVQVFNTVQVDSSDIVTGTQLAFLQVREVVPVSELTITGFSVTGATATVNASGLDAAKSYQLMRSANLQDTPEVVDGPRVVGAASGTFTDSTAPQGSAAFYYLEELP
ncbi:MAG: hypothetical protein Q7Q71_04190 [Verrucomicrobiota bacterium JB023]|nr:hypothetical protein [Verrucomicrobiota bacterium JB023]